MPKQKTHKGLAKRVKVTANGKVKHHRAGTGHLMNTKNAKRRRRLRSASVTEIKTADTMKIMLRAK
jgi:large subunit ribosomal protein L35